MRIFIKNSRYVYHAFLIICLSLCLGSARAGDVARAFLGTADAISVSASSDPAVIESLERLQTSARDRGTVRVIVGVRTAFAPEGSMNAAAAQSQHDDIATTQADLLATIPIGRKDSIKRFKTIPFLAMEVDAGELYQLAQQYGVTSIEEDRAVPPDLSESVPLIGGPTAWNAGYTGQGQTVAILDTGVDKTHPFLAGKVVSEACYSSTYAPQSAASVCPDGAESSTAAGSGVNCGVSGCDHGTHVAGIVAGQGSNFSGVAKDAKLIAVQVFSKFASQENCGSHPAPCALSFTSDQIKALERVYALRTTYSISSVNMSLGGGRYFSQATCDDENASQKAAIDNLRSVGIATVIASGNESFTDSLAGPGCISSAVSVGSTNKSDAVSSFSNSASFLNLLAPGGSINSSVPGGGYGIKSGTSMATPHVAGAWALLKQKTPSLSVAAALNALSSTGQQVVDDRNGISKPRIDLAAALSLGTATLGTPTALAATNRTTDGFAANWTAANGANGYRLDVSANSGFTSYLDGYQNLDVGNSTSRAVNGLSVNTAYYYRVRAYDTANTSGNSNTISVTTASTGPQPLSNGQVVSGLSGAADSELNFYIDVPSGSTTLRVKISGGTGDVDLYLRRDSAPTTSSYDCRPYLSNLDEECVVADPRTGRYYIMLRGYTAYSGATLTASYVAETSIAVPPAPTANAAGNLSATGFTASWGEASRATGYRLDVATDSGFTSYVGGFQNLDVGTSTTRAVSGLAAGTTYYYRVRAYNATGDSGNSNIVTVTTSSSGAQALNNGEVLSGLSGAVGSERRFYIDVPAGATRLTVTLSGGTGDADLYLRLGSAPSTTLYDCSSEKADSNEECLLNNPAAGRYYLLAYGYRDYSGISIKAEYLGANSSGPEPLGNGELRGNLSGAADSERNFYIDVPAGATNLKVEMAGGTGDADLYLRLGGAPTTSLYDCRPFMEGNNEVCTLDNPAAGRYYLLVRGFTAYSGTSLKAEYLGANPAGPEPLGNGEPRNNLGGAAGSERNFYIDVPAGTASLKVEMAGGTGDADLYLRLGGAPTTSLYGCRPFVEGNNEVCTLDNPAAGRYYILVYGFTAYSGISLQADYLGANPAGPQPLGNGELRSNLSGAADSERNFYIDVPAGAASLKVETAGGTGDADLYLRLGGAPTTSLYDCRPFMEGNNETCTLNSPAAGRYYLLIRGFSAYSGLSLNAVYTQGSYSLSVANTGSGAGTVTSSPAGIDCGTDCSETYASGAQVSLTATPAAGSVFAGWAGACSGAGACIPPITGATSVTAIFNDASVDYTLTVTLSGTGTGTVASSPSGIDCGVECTASFSAGTTLNLTATPDDGSFFAGWNSPCSGIGDCTVTMNGTTSLGAVFHKGVGQPLAIRKIGTGGGLVISEPSGIVCGDDCQALFLKGSKVKLIAKPDQGSKFVGWKSPGCGSNKVCKVKMGKALAIAAKFKRK